MKGYLVTLSMKCPSASVFLDILSALVWNRAGFAFICFFYRIHQLLDCIILIPLASW